MYRALAGRADPAEAALTQRRIEHAQAEGTELAKQLSELRARVGITSDKAAKARQAATVLRCARCCGNARAAGALPRRS